MRFEYDGIGKIWFSNNKTSFLKSMQLAVDLSTCYLVKLEFINQTQIFVKAYLYCMKKVIVDIIWPLKYQDFYRTKMPILFRTTAFITDKANACNEYIYIYIYIYVYISIQIFFHEPSRFKGQQEKEEGISLTPLYHFYPLQRHLDISWEITAQSSLLNIASSRTRTGNLQVPRVGP